MNRWSNTIVPASSNCCYLRKSCLLAQWAYAAWWAQAAGNFKSIGFSLSQRNSAKQVWEPRNGQTMAMFLKLLETLGVVRSQTCHRIIEGNPDTSSPSTRLTTVSFDPSLPPPRHLGSTHLLESRSRCGSKAPEKRAASGLPSSALLES